MNFKNNLTSYFALVAILGVSGSVFGVSSLFKKSEPQALLVASDFDESQDHTATPVCSNIQDSFIQDETQVLVSGYAKAASAECLFTGCGGVI